MKQFMNLMQRNTVDRKELTLALVERNQARREIAQQEELVKHFVNEYGITKQLLDDWRNCFFHLITINNGGSIEIPTAFLHESRPQYKWDWADKEGEAGVSILTVTKLEVEEKEAQKVPENAG